MKQNDITTRKSVQSTLSFDGAVKTQALDLRERIWINPIPVRSSTFLAGLAQRVHRWFRLTPSFGPELVQHILDSTQTAPRSRVLDPFSGAGTTLVETKLEGHASFGFEINPLLHFVCATSTNWSIAPELAETTLKTIGSAYESNLTAAGVNGLETLRAEIPAIHNPHRWWRDDVLVGLLCLRKAIDSATQGHSGVRDFFRLALAGVLVPDLTNVTLGRLQLHFIDRTGDEINVWATFEHHSRHMIDDLKAVASYENIGSAVALHTDATCPHTDIPLGTIDRVITSPPYPNRYSYVWNTRPHLYMLGFFSDKSQGSELDLRTIGGTWGTATSILKNDVLPYELPMMTKVLEPTISAVRELDNLMANYLVKYFNLLVRQIQAQHPLLEARAQLAYVVGCSNIKGVYVETDYLLAELFERLELGYRVDSVERFRRRHSGKDLFESTVFVSRM